MTSPALRTLTARSPEDVLAAGPLVLGFVPEHSIAMLTFEARHPFHARLDLPLDAGERREAAQVLLEPCVRHEVRRVFFVLYTHDAEAARKCARALAREFTRQGVDVVDVLRSDGARWFPVAQWYGEPEGPGVPYDVDAHLFTAQSVMEGRVTLRSRTELAQTVAADEERIAAVATAAEAVLADAPDPLDPVAETRSLVEALLASGRLATATEAARVLLAIRDRGPRDEMLRDVGRAEAERRLPLWSALVASAPPDLVAAPASVLAFLAWLAGHGALAWCALDRAAEGDPPCSLADSVTQALEQALPPSVWEEGW
jgi:hypothetical protein